VKKSFIFLVLLYITQTGYSQDKFRNGFIIMQNRDTVFGLLNYSESDNNFSNCQFKESQNKNTTLYSPLDISGYGFIDDKYFESGKIETESQATEDVFLEVLIRGLVSLYKYENIFLIEKSDSGLYKLTNEPIEKTVDGNQVTISSNRYFGILNLFLADCPGSKSKIPRTGFTEKSLSKLIEEYNKCMNVSAVIYKSKKPWVDSRIGLSGGFTHSRLIYETQNTFFKYIKTSFEPSNSPFLGVSLEIFSPRINENTSFHSDLLFFKSKYSLYNKTQNAYYIAREYITIELTQLKIPLGIKYIFPGRRLTSFLSMGVSATVHLNNKSRWIEEVESHSIVETNHNEALNISKAQFGLWGGVGIMKSVNKNLNGFCEFRFERTDGIFIYPTIASPILKSNVTNIQFVIGILTR
jgi:hypothetical protein